MKIETKKNVPNIAKPTSSITVFAALNVELRNRERSSIGRRWCRSRRTKRTRNTTASANSPSTSESVQPRSFDSISPNVSANSPIPDVARPGRSRRCSWDVSRDSSMKIRAAKRPAMPIGMLMKKIQLQSMCSVRIPPTSGPIASASAETPAEQVCELAARQEQDPERERIAVHDPLQLRDRDPEVGADRRQRDVHDRVVEHDHEQPERDGRESPPLPELWSDQAGPHFGVGYRRG